jgi:hypothetical protein
MEMELREGIAKLWGKSLRRGLREGGRLVFDRRQPLCVLQSEANSYAHLVGKPDAPPHGGDPREVSRCYGDGRRIVYLS